MSERKDFIEKVDGLLKEVHVAMMTTRHGDEMYSRPMVTHRTSSGSDFDGTLYFLTSNTTGKCNDLVRFPKVNLAYSHPGKNTFVSVSGRAELMVDPGKVDELWHPMNNVYFSGKDDPDIVVIKVEAESVEYWDSPSSSIMQAYRMVRTALTGEWDTMGDHERKRIAESA